MKIARVKIYLIAGGKLQPVIVEIVTDEGVSGIGEAASPTGSAAPRRPAWSRI